MTRAKDDRSGTEQRKLAKPQGSESSDAGTFDPFRTTKKPDPAELGEPAWKFKRFG